MFRLKNMTLLAIIASCINMVFAIIVYRESGIDFVTVSDLLFDVFLQKIILTIINLIHLAFFIAYWRHLSNYKTFKILTVISFILELINILWPIEIIDTGIYDDRIFTCSLSLSWAIFSLGLLLSRPSSDLLRITAIANVLQPVIVFFILTLSGGTMMMINISNLIKNICIITLLASMYVSQIKNFRRSQHERIQKR